MQNDKIDEITLDGEEESYADAVEQFLQRRMIQERISVFFIGDDGVYLRQLANEFEPQANLEKIGRSDAAMEQVMMQLNGCSPDVILFDVGSCMTHHIRTIQLIRNICPQAKLLAIMPDDLPLHIRQASWCGVHAWILKEQSFQKVISKITALHECQRYMSTALDNTNF